MIKRIQAIHDKYNQELTNLDADAIVYFGIAMRC